MEKVSDEEIEARAVPDVVHAIIGFVRGRQAPSWSGTASGLFSAVGGDVRANALSKYLNKHSAYVESQGVLCSRRGMGDEKLICLERVGLGRWGQWFGHIGFHRPYPQGRGASPTRFRQRNACPLIAILEGSSSRGETPRAASKCHPAWKPRCNTG